MSTRVCRRTAETDVSIELDLTGGQVDVDTGVGFLDHLLRALAHHGRMGLTVRASGDLDTGSHHLAEDVGLVMGQALAAAWGDRQGLERFGSALVPMDDALVLAAVDAGGRPHLAMDMDIPYRAWGSWDSDSWPALLGGLVARAGATVHLRGLAGRDPHHLLEAGAKALGMALGQASARTARGSTKGPEEGSPPCK